MSATVAETPRKAPRSLPRRIARWLFVPACVYAAWCALLWFKQGDMLFPRDMAVGLSDPPADALVMYRDIGAATDPSAPRVEAWYFQGEGCSADRPGPAVFLFHGNADLINNWDDIARAYTQRGVNVLLCEYRGYGRSGGTPSQSAIVDDATYFYDLVVLRPEVRRDAIISHGRSLGGGVAAQLAAKRPVAALVLDETFTSVASFASGYGVPTLLVRNPFRTDDVLRTFKGAVFIAHGTRDVTIPYTHGTALASLRPDAVFVACPADHMNFPGDDEAYWQALEAFLVKSDLINAAPTK